ncbi:hypothetical protein O6H91_08G084100 [Diphasiastrum complanatum]|uniref:Uncharacterized protein n=1 Tax=Diphasiastrum complanatum TaxID=34168 RepID=A0ACC2CZK0_DIPCM|nr:hypothetical protein O6H91_08G084100 [Diphasiastrum complanatum]
MWQFFLYDTLEQERKDSLVTNRPRSPAEAWHQNVIDIINCNTGLAEGAIGADAAGRINLTATKETARTGEIDLCDWSNNENQQNQFELHSVKSVRFNHGRC